MKRIFCGIATIPHNVAVNLFPETFQQPHTHLAFFDARHPAGFFNASPRSCRIRAAPARQAFFVYLILHLGKIFLHFYLPYGKNKPRTAGKAEGISPTGRSTEANRRSPDGANTQRTERRTAHAARRISRKPREGSRRETTGSAGSAGKGASVNRRAGQHDDAKKAGF